MVKCKYEGTGIWDGRCIGTKEVDPCPGYDKCKQYKPNYTTNADRLDAMSIDEKAQFLHSIAYNRETPWSKPFYEKFCKDCPAPEYILDDGRKLCLHECDFKDGKCPYGTDIVWWLQQPSK